MGDVLFEMLFLIIAVAFLGALAYAVLFRDRAYPMERHSQTDLTNMMIMFQTMRDLVQDQKEMARQFNASLDKKVATVRKLVSDARSEREKLWQAQQRLAAMLEEVKEELASVQRQVGYVRHAANPPVQQEPRRQPPRDNPGPGRVPADSVSIPAVSLDEPAHFDDYTEEDSGDVIDSWTGLDYGEEPAAEEPESHVPDEPEDPHAAREAFRSLLNFDSEGGDAAEPGGMAKAHGNGSSRMTTIERRVYEYRDAGMEIPDIARELGVDRQEVRLILSARQARPHGYQGG